MAISFKTQWGIIVLSLLFRIGHPTETYAQLEGLKFDSETEKQLFADAAAGSFDHVALLSIAGRTLDGAEISRIKSELDKDAAAIYASGVMRKSPAKQAKFIFSYVHDKYLKKYELENYFADVFNRGYYNCVSASAIYALLFTKLKIEHTLVQTPDHVYMIGWPSTSRIIIESTDPVNGYFTVTTRYKSALVNNMISQKMIEPNEHIGQSTDEIYNSLAGEEHIAIDLDKIVGLQYHNLGVYKLESEHYEEAIDYLEKALFIYPYSASHQVINYTRAQYLLKEPYTSARYPEQMSKWVNDSLNNDNQEFAKLNYARIVQSRPTAQEFDSFSTAFISGIKDSIVKSDYLTLHYDYLIRESIERLNYSTALRHADDYLLHMPLLTNAQDLFIYSFMLHFKPQGNLDLIVEECELALQKHPSLSDSPKFRSLQADVYIFKALEYFALDQPIQALSRITQFEQSMSKADLSMVSLNALSAAYGEASSYFFRKGNASLSKKYLEKGLSYDPSSYELLTKKRLLLNYGK